jgi:heme/copper-type cytochrome/quinol oxidase subunit 2
MNNLFEANIQEIIINIIVIIIGLIIGIIIGYYLFNIYIYKGPDSNIISKEIYIDIFGNKYKWIPKICVCPISYSMDKLHNKNYIDPNH